MSAIYEVVDSTGDEHYWTLGVFTTLAEADATIAGGPEEFGNPCDHDDSLTVEIRERRIGWHPMETGKVVRTRTWVHTWDDDADSKWKETP